MEQSKEEEENDPVTKGTEFDLQKVFLWQDNSSTLLANGQFAEAFGVLDERNRMGVALRTAPVLLNICASLVATENDHEDIKKELRSIFAMINPSYQALIWLAKKLRIMEKFFAAFIVTELCFEMFFDENNPYQAIGTIEDCVNNLNQTATDLAENGENFETFVRQKILPKMYDMKQTLHELQNIDPHFKCVKSAYVVHGIEVIEQTPSREKILLETLNGMKDILGEKTKNHHIYGTLCNNLGSTYLEMGLRDEAITYFKQALECFNSAADFNPESKRAKYIQITKRAMLRANGQETEIETVKEERETACPIS